MDKEVFWSEIYLKDLNAPYWSTIVRPGNWLEDDILNAFIEFPEINQIVADESDKRAIVVECFNEFKKGRAQQNAAKQDS